MYIILGKPTCGFCKASLALCAFKNKKYIFINIDEPNNKKMCKKLNKYVPKNYKYVPKIIYLFKNKYKFIGGHNELKTNLKVGGGIHLKKTKKGKCSPKYTKKKNNKTCYDKKALIEIIDAYNQLNVLDKIETNTKDTIDKLWDKLDKKLELKCNDEACWSKVTNKNNLVKTHFRPYKKLSWEYNPRRWLDTNDINNVLSQYENKYTSFKYLGCIPMHFDTKLNNECVDKTHCSFNLKNELNGNKKYFASVYNLQKHNESGSHWVATFINSPKKEVYFFDSTSNKPYPEIVNFVNRIIKQSLEIGPKYEFKINTYAHQKKDTECGVYCINFIENMIQGVPFDDYISNIQDDDIMFQNRDKYFS